jgi:WD40 repeat protein
MEPHWPWATCPGRKAERNKWNKITGHYYTDVTLWDITTKKQIGVLSGNPNLLTAIAFSPDGKFLATVGGQATLPATPKNARTGIEIIKVFDVASCRERASVELKQRYPGDPIGVQRLVYTPDGRYLAADVFYGLILLDSKTLERVKFIEPNSEVDHCRAISGDARYLALEGKLATITIRDLVSNNEDIKIVLKDHFPDLEHKIPTFFKQVAGCRITFLNDKTLLVAACGRIMTVDINSRAVMKTIAETDIFLFPYAISQSGRHLAAGRQDTGITLWDIEREKRLWVCPHIVPHVTFLFFGNGGKTVVVVSNSPNAESCQVKLLDAATGEEL